MNEDIENAKGYLKGRLEECRSRPDLHKHISKVYEDYLRIVQTRPDDYAKEAGDMFAVMRAEMLDRQENLIILYNKLNHPESAKAHEIQKEAVLSSKGYGDIHRNISAAETQTRGLSGISAARRDAMQELMALITAWKVGLASEKAGKKSQILEKWKQLQSLDPQMSWKTLRDDPACRRCLYFNSEQLDLMEKYFQEAVR